MDTAFTGCESPEAAKKMDKAATGRARYRYVLDKSWLTHHLDWRLEADSVHFHPIVPTSRNNHQLQKRLVACPTK